MSDTIQPTRIRSRRMIEREVRRDFISDEYHPDAIQEVAEFKGELFERYFRRAALVFFIVVVLPFRFIVFIVANAMPISMILFMCYVLWLVWLVCIRLQGL